MIQNLIIGILFFENTTSGIKHFYISPDVPIDNTRAFFLNFRFSSRKSQSQQKLAKKITHFTMQFRSTILQTSTHLTLKMISSRNSQKSFWLCKFSSRHVSVWCQKKYLHCTLSWRPIIAFLKHFESKCLYISKHPLMKIFLLET